jgi:hypothetical protein
MNQNMKSYNFIVLACILIFTACQNNKTVQEGHTHHHIEEPGPTQADTPQRSIPKESHAQVGSVHITINYYSPAVRGRIIWGGLVPFDEVWVTGAHNATNISISQAIKVNGVIVPKGKYAFFTIPGREEWTLILNKNWEQHLTDNYDPADDIVRIKATPDKNLSLSERLTYFINDLGQGNGSITMEWENLSVSFLFSEK